MKFVLADRLPLMSYLTTLDKYLVGSYLVMALLVLHVCIRAKVRVWLAVAPESNISDAQLGVSSHPQKSSWFAVVAPFMEAFHNTSDESLFLYYLGVWILGHAVICYYYFWFHSKYFT
jgi:hypothetical protein